MLLFLAYPGVSLKVLRLFKCRKVEGEWWLEADMRMQCYNGHWAGYALYGLLVAIVYIVGLPLGEGVVTRDSGAVVRFASAVHGLTGSYSHRLKAWLTFCDPSCFNGDA